MDNVYPSRYYYKSKTKKVNYLLELGAFQFAGKSGKIEKNGKEMEAGMKRTREQIKAVLLKEYEEELDRLLNWEEKAKRPTLSQIEEQVLASRKKMSEEMLKEMLRGQESQSPVEGVKCPKCGKLMEDKGKEPKLVETRAGSILMERTRYYCPDCKIGIFPPG